MSRLGYVLLGMSRLGYVLLGMFLGILLMAALILLNGPAFDILRPVKRYSEFLEMIDKGAIESVSIHKKLFRVSGKDGSFFYVPVLSPEKVADKLIEKHVEVDVDWEVDEDRSLGVAPGIALWLIYLSVVWFLMGRPLYRISATLARHEAAGKGDAKE